MMPRVDIYGGNARTNMMQTLPPEPQDDGITLHADPEDIWGHIDIAMVRPRFEWIETDRKYLNLHLGAGSKHMRSAINLDYPEWDAHSPQRGKWMLPYGDECIGHVFSYHTLDHLQPHAVVRTLAEIERVLIPGGTFVNIVPHYMGQLANECIMHHSRFGIDTFRNIFSERQYSHAADGVQWTMEHPNGWQFDIGANFIYGQTERNLVLVTQLVKRIPDARTD
jgi:hypothetical protein